MSSAGRSVRCRTKWFGGLVFALCLVLLAGATTSCSKGDENESSPATTTNVQSGPAADVSQELTGGNGVFMASASGVVVPDGYVETEYVAAGSATDYRSVGDMGADGNWTFEPDTTADYRTRVVVRRPENPEKASGTVVVEWLNVSSGLDANPDYANLGDEIVRNGDIWIGVSAQLIGVEGGPVLVDAVGGLPSAGKGLKVLDPERYGSLSHPGDGFSYDIFTQVARAARRGGDFTGGIESKVILAAGQSQSATALVTYYNGVQPLTSAFDGFFVHSRAFVALPLVAPGEPADLMKARAVDPVAVAFRGDLSAPIMNIQAEGDLVGSLASAKARQPDSDTFSLWEVTGTAHADRHMLGPVANAVPCGVPVNDGPMNLVASAALRALAAWVRDGTEPPAAEWIEMDDATPSAIVRDSDGIALGGVRTPVVDVPIEVLSGAPGPSGGLMCELVGSTTPLPAARLAEMYPDRVTYEKRFADSTDAAVKAGFILEADREAIIAMADGSLLAG